MTTGRPRNFPPCPDCQQSKSEQLLLSWRGERITGVWVVDWVATAHYSTPLVEKEPVFCTADEYEEMVS